MVPALVCNVEFGSTITFPVALKVKVAPLVLRVCDPAAVESPAVAETTTFPVKVLVPLREADVPLIEAGPVTAQSAHMILRLVEVTLKPPVPVVMFE
jgi:hypothetical protein